MSQPTEEEQEEYFRLTEAEAKATADVREFWRRHDGKSFRVFRPEVVMAAVSNDVKPLVIDHAQATEPNTG